MEAEVVFPEKWSPPRELMRAVPRDLRISARGMFMGVLAAAFLVASIWLGTWMHNQGLREAENAARLHSDGQQATAEISGLATEGKGSKHTVKYLFTVNGKRMSGDSEVPDDVWPRIRTAGFLPVIYLPSDPSVNHAAAWDAPVQPAWMPIAVPAMWVVGSTIMLIVLRRQKQVAAEGLPAPGVVTKCFRVKGGWAARYQFKTQDGTVAKGRDKVWRKVEPGATVCILYLPDYPKRNYIYPVSLYNVSQ